MSQVNAAGVLLAETQAMTTKLPKSTLKTKLSKAILQFEMATRDHAVRGSKDPDSIVIIDSEYKAAKAKLKRIVTAILDKMSVTIAQDVLEACK